ncbi:MAG: hypothetical protein ABI910_09795 [Gemmatimonadota bacterium]
MLVLLRRLDRVPSLLAALLALCTLALQPDAAQAAAFAVGWSVHLAMARGRSTAGLIALALLLASITVFRTDPLQPVPYVEGIVGLAGRQGGTWAAASLIALTLPSIVLTRAPDRRSGAVLAAYVSGTILAGWLGNFPVPFLGYGVSPILGYYLAIAALGRRVIDVAFESSEGGLRGQADREQPRRVSDEYQ